jgi:outer membrane lipoprotein-sorting protein
MANRRTTLTGRRIAATVAVTGGVGLGLLAVPTGAGAQPQLPPVAAEELVASVLAAKKEPFAGTVQVDNALGLPMLPDAPQAANGTSTARVWSNGDAGRRVQLPSDGGERTLVSDGTTFWAWNSEDRTVVTGPRQGRPADTPGATSDPTTAANETLTRLRNSSDVTVDGTAEVAGRPAYELVLSPKPTERTLLREVRIAVDAEKRSPLRMTVLGNGSPDPALQIGFTELTFGPQDQKLFTFTPPPGATVQPRPPGRSRRPRPDRGRRGLGHRRHPQAAERAPPWRAGPVHTGHSGQRSVGQRAADQRGDRDRYRHRRRPDRGRRRPRTGAERGPRQVTP